MQATYLQSLTDGQLYRLLCRIYARMADGGAMYGIDRPTMRIVHPGLLAAYDAVSGEYYSRQDADQLAI